MDAQKTEQVTTRNSLNVRSNKQGPNFMRSQPKKTVAIMGSRRSTLTGPEHNRVLKAQVARWKAQGIKMER